MVERNHIKCMREDCSTHDKKNSMIRDGRDFFAEAEAGNFLLLRELNFAEGMKKLKNSLKAFQVENIEKIWIMRLKICNLYWKFRVKFKIRFIFF